MTSVEMYGVGSIEIEDLGNNRTKLLVPMGDDTLLAVHIPTTKLSEVLSGGRAALAPLLLLPATTIEP